MNGKRKCKLLKSIRQKIARDNDIPFVSPECTHQGECRGTCPACEGEVRYLENELLKRKAAGQSVSVAGSAMLLSRSHTEDTAEEPAPQPKPDLELPRYGNETAGVFVLERRTPNTPVDESPFNRREHETMGRPADLQTQLERQQRQERFREMEKERLKAMEREAMKGLIELKPDNADESAPDYTPYYDAFTPAFDPLPYDDSPMGYLNLDLDNGDIMDWGDI